MGLVPLDTVLYPLKHFILFTTFEENFNLYTSFIPRPSVLARVIMSTTSKLTLLSTILGTAGIVAFVHWAQTAEQAV